jgi:hypothetical protein
VGFSKGFRATRASEIQTLTMPELFVYTCLGPNVPDSVQKAFFETGILFEDDRTVIQSVEPAKIRINRDLYRYEIDPEHIHSVEQGLDPLPTLGYDAVFSRVRLKDKQAGYSEELDLLYVLGENINFYEQVVRRGRVEVLHLCTIREGLCFGGGRRSVIQHAFKGTGPLPDFLKPETIVSFSDGTFDIIQDRLSFDFMTDPGRAYAPARREFPADAFVIGEGIVLRMNWDRSPKR